MIQDPNRQELSGTPENAYTTQELISTPFIKGEDLRPERINVFSLLGDIEKAGFN